MVGDLATEEVVAATEEVVRDMATRVEDLVATVMEVMGAIVEVNMLFCSKLELIKLGIFCVCKPLHWIFRLWRWWKLQ